MIHHSLTGNTSKSLHLKDHHFSTDTHFIYKDIPSFQGQASESIGGRAMYLFAKIQAQRSTTSSTATYSVAVGSDEELMLYQAERVIGASFMAQINTCNPSVCVGKLLPLRGPKLELQVAAGADVAAVLLVGEATVPTGGSLAVLPGASLF